MKILVITQYYYPEPFKIHEICEELVGRGNEVTVVTGLPNYPSGELYEGYSNSLKWNEKINGVNIIRTPIHLRGKSSVSLIMNYLSYPLKAIKALKDLKTNFDIIFVYQLSPVLMIFPAIYYKRKHGTSIYTYCLDLWPESLKVLKLKDNNPIYKLIGGLSNFIYSKCDFISVTSPAFIKYLNETNKVDQGKIDFIPQHGENLFLKVNNYCPNEKLIITFAGNIGKAQDLSTLVNAVSLLSERYLRKLEVIILGDGSYLEQLEQQIKKKELTDVIKLEGRKKLEDLIPYYTKTSLFYISLEKGSQIGNTIPSKLQTYMSAGRGIIGSIDGVTKSIVHEANAGIICEAGDYRELAHVIMNMIDEDKKVLLEYGKSSRKYFIENFTLDMYVDKVVKKMEELKNE